MDRRHYSCVLCRGRPPPQERRPVQSGYINILSKKFAVGATESDVLCNKCRHKCRNISRKREVCTIPVSDKDEANDPSFTSPKRTKLTEISSPPSVALPFSSSTKSHGYCFVCKKPGPKLISLSNQARLHVLIIGEIIIPSGARCCTGHLINGKLSEKAIENIKTSEGVMLNRTAVYNIIQDLREIVFRNSRLDFDDEGNMDDDDYKILTGLTRREFEDVVSTVTSINSTKIRRAIKSGRKALITDFVPQNLGFQHITREAVIENHTRQLARDLFTNSATADPAILVLDGTYVYIQKSSNFAFARRSYSMHKHRPLVKPMMVVTTTGYIISVLGPYLADSKNNDASILKHIILHNTEEMKSWLKEDDVFVVDRGFRDTGDVLEDLGIQMEMPSFIQRGDKQLTTHDSNISRVVTKVRWVVEAANARLKQWKYLEKTLPNTQIPFIGDYIRIVSAICNSYRPPLCTTTSDDQSIAAKMLHLSRKENALQKRVEEEGLDKRPVRWVKVDAEQCAPDFPKYDENGIRELTLGVYQLRMARSYTHEHTDIEGKYEILVSDDIQGILSAKIQSRHISARNYQCWISYNDGVIDGWFCKCKAGSRVVGMCGHITSVVWFLAHARHEVDSVKGVRNWSTSVNDASDLPEIIDESDSDEDSDVEE
ncbi:uncharacterized protein LOC133184966 [Saccostrea echinata]|uniref:uncharacterized protein LOC133184966 n=1 Tax=Saccostrea echinata TaxID=191078 RepID=UPI002A841DCC|nr:uncharacterized protein LOC133184966 [Saccostrea echinata]